MLLCELKLYEGFDRIADAARAEQQLLAYAESEDFETLPPFLLLYDGRPEEARFYRRRDGAAGYSYERLPEMWHWARIKDAQVRGSFATEVVDRGRLLQILLFHLDRIEDDVRADVAHAVRAVVPTERPAMLSDFGRWLWNNPTALEDMRRLRERKLAELPRDDESLLTEELVTQAAVNYLLKVFFLALCEERNLPGFYRVLREFLPETRAITSPTTATVFLALLRRKLRDATSGWGEAEQHAYRDLRDQLVPHIGERVIEQNNWWQLIRVAFDLAEERFPLVYRDDALDLFRPGKEALAELVYDLSTKSFSGLDNRSIGDVYEGLLSSRRERRRRRSTLGAFYTPGADVDYMIGQLELTIESKVLDPCMGSGHFVEGLHDALVQLHADQGIDGDTARQRVLQHQLFGADIDSFATALTAIRLFLIGGEGATRAPNLFVHDMLLHSPERPTTELFSPEILAAEGHEHADAEGTLPPHQELDSLGEVDQLEFDAVVGNPPYGARRPAYKRPIYRRLYGRTEAARRQGSIGTGDADSYTMFFANGIERLREGGRLCLITNDSFRSLISHADLRRHILDRCKIVEILLTDTHHFHGVSFQFAGMAITTLQKCSSAEERRQHRMRLIDYLRDPADFGNPPPDRVTELRQEEYERLPDTPFVVGVPREVFESAARSGRVRNVARGRQGLATADDRRFLAGIGQAAPELPHRIELADLAEDLSPEQRRQGVPAGRPHWVPFGKGEGFGEYFRRAGVAVDWSQDSVDELERRAAWPAGTPRRPRFQNRDYYFLPGLTYSFVSGGRLSVRLLPEGWIFGHKGSAIFVENDTVPELFLLGYLNSALATYFMKRIVNTTATADVGYVERLPFRPPDATLAANVVKRTQAIIDRKTSDPDADVEDLRREIDTAIFDLFEIEGSRELVLRFYETVGLVQTPTDEVTEAEA
ncbi:MAG: Eco57I restriction-modification methylase domain-containing protein [Solirubrobacteraceae bacterium]